MDQLMQDDLPSPSRSRKRSSAWVVEDDISVNEDVPTEPDYTPSKRLLSSRGEAIQTNKVIKYNAQKLLNHLAFTRVYVTANFHNYSPNKSFIVLCMVSRQDEMYQALCRLLPSLYNVSPTLQALAITDGYISPGQIPDQGLLRMLPLVTTAGMEVTIEEDLQSFRRELDNNENCIAVVDHRGICVWHAAKDIDSTSSVDFDALLNIITDANVWSSQEDVEMENG